MVKLPVKCERCGVERYNYIGCSTPGCQTQASQSGGDLFNAASALLADVRRRYPGEELRCEYMRALDAAIIGHRANTTPLPEAQASQAESNLSPIDDFLLSEKQTALIETMRGALKKIETAPQPHDTAHVSEWKAAFYIQCSLARAAIAQAEGGEQENDDGISPEVIARVQAAADEAMKGQTYMTISSIEWPDEANKAVEFFRLQSEQRAAIIETLKEALDSALVAMRIASASPAVSKEYDFAPAISEVIAALARCSPPPASAQKDLGK